MTAMTTMPEFFPVSSGDGYAGYVRAVEAIPAVSEEEEKQLIADYHQNDDVEAARRLALGHLRLVVAIVRGYNGYGLDSADLAQEGNIGLLKAIKKFNPEKGARLATFATYWIRAEIHNFIMRNWRIVKIATTKAQRKLFFNMRKLFEQGKDSAPRDAAKVADELGVRTEDVRDMRARIRNTNSIALSMENDEGEQIGADVELSANTETSDPESILIEQQTGEDGIRGLGAALKSLDERGRAIIHARRLSEPPETLQTLGKRLGVSAERVRQLETRAMEQLRRHMLA